MAHKASDPDLTGGRVVGSALPALPALGILLAAIAFGLVPFFAKSLTDAGAHPAMVALLRTGFAALILLPIVYLERGQWRTGLWALSAGAAIGLGWVGYVTAIKTAPVSVVGVLYMSYPVFTLAIGWFLFADPPSRRAIIATALIVLAALIASSPAAVAPEHLPMLLLSLCAPAGFGYGICVLVHRLSGLSPLGRVAWVSLGSTAGLTPMVVAAQASLGLPADLGGWALILGLGLATALIPQLVFVICAPRVGTARAAVLGSVELPTMVAVGALAFGEVITLAQGLACALVLVAIILTRSRRTRNVATQLSAPEQVRAKRQ